MRTDRLPGEPDRDAFDQWVFYGLLGLLLWAPLPLGSNRAWAVGLLLLGSVALLAGTCWAWRGRLDRAAVRVAKFRVPIGLLLLMLLLCWLQTLSLPASFVSLLSPQAALVQGSASFMTFSLDVAQTRLMTALTFVYFTVFTVAVLTVRSNTRMDLVARALVASAVFQVVFGAVMLSLKAQYQIFFVEVLHDRMRGTYVYHNSLAGY